MTAKFNDLNQQIKRDKAEEELYKKACDYLPGGISRNVVYCKPNPHYAAEASGCYVTDILGVKRIDFANNMASLIHGHSHPSIVNAVIEQIKKGTAYTLATEAEIRLAELLCNRVKSIEKIRFVNSGTEAVMQMIKASRAFTGRSKIAKAEGAYHGTYDFAEASQTSSPENWGDSDSPNINPLVHGTPQGVLNDVIVYHFNDIDKTLAILDKHAEEIACVIIDPVPHRVGLMQASGEHVEALYKWTRKNGALLAFDEVISFRINYGGAQASYPVIPDLTALGKIIGGGFPVGAIAGRSEVMKVFDQRESKLLFPLSGTFSANPVTTTAGRVALELYDEESVKNLNTLTQKAINQLQETIRIADVPVSITGAGSMFKIHFRPNPPETYREAWESKEKTALIQVLLNYLYDKKIMMVNTCSCMFSTALTPKEVDLLAEAMLSGFRLIKPELEKVQK